MKLIRELGDFPKLHKGPKAGGCFWALKTHNDLPKETILIEADLGYLLKVGKVWFQNCQKPNGWKEIKKVSNVPSFNSYLVDDYDRCISYVVFEPFLVEFYFLPTSWRGKRFLKRAETRAKSRD